MKKIIRRFAPRTILAVLLVLFAVAAVTAWAAENNNSNTKNEIDLQFSTKIQLTTYVDGAWSDALSDDYGFGDTANLTAPALHPLPGQMREIRFPFRRLPEIAR